MRWCLLALLLLPSLARADVLRICDTGDLQEATRCINPDTAWDHIETAIDYIAATPGYCDVVLFPGDIVNGFDWGEDCWCMAQDDGDCTQYTNPFTDEQCGVGECGDAQAAACLGGDSEDPRHCEWDRARHLVDTLEAAGVPWIVSAGNHEWDSLESAECESQFATFNEYFGAGRMSALFDETGILEQTVSCSGLPSGLSEQPDSSYHVLTAAGAQWLFISIAWSPLLYESDIPYRGMTQATKDWLDNVLGTHPRIPTIPITHTMLTVDCYDGYCGYDTDDYEDAWCAQQCGAFNEWPRSWAGMTIFDTFLPAYPQIFLTIGAHIKGLAHHMSTTLTHNVAGMVFDYSNENSPPGDPAWHTADNGGGGVIQVIGVDPVRGVIWTHGYSPKENELFNVISDTEPSSHYSFQMPLCSDDVRFDFPAAACPEGGFALRREK